MAEDVDEVREPGRDGQDDRPLFLVQADEAVPVPNWLRWWTLPSRSSSAPALPWSTWSSTILRHVHAGPRLTLLKPVKEAADEMSECCLLLLQTAVSLWC